MAYGPAIREAIASNNLNKMKSVASLAEKQIKEHGDLEVALLELKEAIQKLEGS